jgi:N6-adenosine-specific RNA methylase IME4/ParB-like chromosome segregation protein Spo0J
MKLRLSDITVKQGRRAVNESKVRELAQSMSEVGLINPITVTQDKTLITGAHRLAAAKLLGWAEIEATVSELEGFKAELAEIDENLMRNELHYLDEGAAYKRRDELLDEMGMRREVGRYSNQVESTPLKTTEEIAAELGVSKSTYKQAKQIARDILPEAQEAIKAADLPKRDALKIARMEPEQQVKVAEKLNDGAKSLVDAQRLIKREEVHETPELSGKYRVIYADPPWSYGDKSPAYHGTVENHYPTMSLAEICDLPVKEIAEDNAVLFMWTTSPLLEDSFEVINAWGFKYKSSFVWDKVKHNMGHYNSVRHEFLLIATKGSCLPEYSKLFDSVVSEERTEHSKKPQIFRNIIETLYPSASKVELFARSQAFGWDTWGNQA